MKMTASFVMMAGLCFSAREKIVRRHTTSSVLEESCFRLNRKSGSVPFTSVRCVKRLPAHSVPLALSLTAPSTVGASSSENQTWKSRFVTKCATNFWNKKRKWKIQVVRQRANPA